MSDLKKKPAIITGASQGIGVGIAQRLSASGWDVALIARREAQLEEIAAGITSAGGKVTIWPCDVANADSVNKTFAAIKEECGGFGALVNNAGITRDALLVRMKEEQWSDVMKVNLDGSYHCLRAVSPLMMRAREGRIVNITSVVGQMGNAGQVNYAASKAGMIGMTRAAARELASRGVTVNAVAPGFIETDMTSDLPESTLTQMKSQIPLQRLGTVNDIAAIVDFLLSEDASYITGQVFNCDGGMVMS